MYRKTIICIFFLVSWTFAWTQNYSFEHITTTEGLSQNDINDILQDKNGFLWIGTNDGLNRFDGYNFKTFRYEPFQQKGISSNLVYFIDEDSDGNLWLGTSDEGVCFFDVSTEQFKVYKNTTEQPNLLCSNQISNLLAAKDGSVWVGTNFGFNILTFNKDKEIESVVQVTPNNFPQLKSPTITSITEDIYGRKWVGTKKGLYIFSEKDDKIDVVTVNDWAYVRQVFIFDNEVYAALTIGVVKIDFDWENPTGFSLQNICTENSNSIVVSRYGDLFIGTNKGLFYCKRNMQRSNNFEAPVHYSEGLEKNDLNKNVITALFEDKSGIIWIGTNGGGLNKYNPKLKKFRHFKKTRNPGSLSYNKIRAFYEDREQNIWIATEGGGVNFLHHSKNKNFTDGFQHINLNETDGQNHSYSFIDLNETGPVNMYVGSGYPVVNHVFNIKGKIPELISNGILDDVVNSTFSAIRDRNGNVWLGTYGLAGLYKYWKDETGEHLLNFNKDSVDNGMVSNTIRSLLEDSYGNIWIGTDSGLNLLTPEEQNKKNPHFKSFKKDNSKAGALSHNYILPLFQAADKTMWVGTMGGGLNKVIYHPNTDSIKFEAITVKDGLPNNVIKGILEDDYGFLWVSSNKGLTRFDVTDNLFVNYDVSDGLQDNEFSELACWRLSDGEMLFGGVNGFNAFYPKDIASDMTTPEVALTDFHILNQEINAGEKVKGRVVLKNAINHAKQIKLKFTENSFSVYFSSLHFSAPGKNSYKYMLEGFDADWTRKDATDRIAKYTNLPPGHYTLKVMASNNDGVWNDTPKQLDIIITPPWYLSIVAWLAYVSLFLGGLWFFQRYSLIRIKQKNELLMEHFEKEKIQELSQMKLRFFTNISHEFRTPLTLIIGPIEKLIQQGGYDKKTIESHSIIHRNASILLRLINQLVDFRRFEQGKMKLRASNSDVVSFLNGVFVSFTELARSKNIDYNFSKTRENIALWFDDDKLERIMYNLLSNAFKFTPKGGKISLVVDEDDYHVVVKVIDNGVGITEEMQKHIFERFYQAERIKNRKVGSTGIGLSFIKGLVEMHKGEISFESEEDSGTTFIVKLKKGTAHLQEEEMREVTRETPILPNFSYLEPAKVEDTESETQDDEEKETVLLVEDNFELRRFILDSLKSEYHVELAENGKEGLEKIYECNPDIVVSDIMMPVMDGFQLCESIKSNENISHIPLLLLTAKSTAENRIKGYDLGADGYISKPFSIEVLEARIKNLIESREKLRAKLRGAISVEPTEVTTTVLDEKFLKRTLKIVEDNMSESEFTVAQLAEEYGMTQTAFNKKLKSLTGLAPKAFIRSMRLKRAAQLLATTKYTVSDITFEVGFLDKRYFRQCFKKEFGMLPAEYVQKHKDL